LSLSRSALPAPGKAVPLRPCPRVGIQRCSRVRQASGTAAMPSVRGTARASPVSSPDRDRRCCSCWPPGAGRAPDADAHACVRERIPHAFSTSDGTRCSGPGGRPVHSSHSAEVSSAYLICPRFGFSLNMTRTPCLDRDFRGGRPCEENGRISIAVEAPEEKASTKTRKKRTPRDEPAGRGRKSGQIWCAQSGRTWYT
jgi:hypothetical protein